MKSALITASSALLIVACASNPAEDPVQIKLNDMDARLGSVERVVNNQSLVDMSRRLDALEAQLREQHGNVEVLQNASEGARKAQRDLYADLDKRISALEGGAHATPGAASPVPVDDQSAYNDAFDKLKGGSYADAILGFRDFMTQYQSSELLDNAQYWIGEAYYVTRDYEHAAQAFRAVGERWPDSRKAPDALVKLGFTQFEQKHLSDARATLELVVTRFPGTDAARLAQERLRKLPPEGR